MDAKGAAGRTLDRAENHRKPKSVYAALDLGTNNCRLLIARPGPEGIEVIDAFSRIVRLGEDLSVTGRLGEGAMRRTLDALMVCRDKMLARGVTQSRLVATEACRAGANGQDFLAEVRRQTGLDIEVVNRETEASLAAEGCAALAEAEATSVVLFDIGGGSSEIVWLAGRGHAPRGGAGMRRETDVRGRIKAWISLPLGVVSLAERFGGKEVTAATFGAMVDCVAGELACFAGAAEEARDCEKFHLLGTSGTVTTVAGVHLGLSRYDRRRIDGMWMSDAEVTQAIARLRTMPFRARVAHGCIGPDRADLVLAGCAILEALRGVFPNRRLRIADRGLREGILIQLMNRDGAWNRAADAVRIDGPYPRQDHGVDGT